MVNGLQHALTGSVVGASAPFIGFDVFLLFFTCFLDLNTYLFDKLFSFVLRCGGTLKTFIVIILIVNKHAAIFSTIFFNSATPYHLLLHTTAVSSHLFFLTKRFRCNTMLFEIFAIVLGTASICVTCR